MWYNRLCMCDEAREIFTYTHTHWLRTCWTPGICSKKQRMRMKKSGHTVSVSCLPTVSSRSIRDFGYVCVCVCVCVYVCMFVCMYVYICMYVGVFERWTHVSNACSIPIVVFFVLGQRCEHRKRRKVSFVFCFIYFVSLYLLFNTHTHTHTHMRTHKYARTQQ